MKVSVIIPAYNAAAYILDAINSCLIQDEVGEIIVVDDCSTDETVEIIERMRCDIIRLIKSPNRNGPSHAINLGIKNANCQLLTVIGADDFYLENRFKENIKFLVENPDFDGTYEIVQNFKEPDAKFSSEHSVDYIELKEDVKADKLFNYIIKDQKPYFSIISVLYKNRYEKNIYNDLTLRYGQDIDFIYNLTMTYKLQKIVKSHPQIMRRLHKNNNTSNVDFISFDARSRILDKWYNKAVNLELSIIPTLYLIYRKASKEYCLKYSSKISQSFGIIVKIAICFKLIFSDFLMKKIRLSHNN